MGKRYYKISEVSDLLGEPLSTLRFWEKEFDSFLKIKRTNNIRYYSVENIETLQAIQYLLREANYKIDGVREQLLQDRRRLLGRVDLSKQLSAVREELIAIRRELNMSSAMAETVIVD